MARLITFPFACLEFLIQFKQYTDQMQPRNTILLCASVFPDYMSIIYVGTTIQSPRFLVTMAMVYLPRKLEIYIALVHLKVGLPDIQTGQWGHGKLEKRTNGGTHWRGHFNYLSISASQTKMTAKNCKKQYLDLYVQYIKLPYFSWHQKGWFFSDRNVLET